MLIKCLWFAPPPPSKGQYRPLKEEGVQYAVHYFVLGVMENIAYLYALVPSSPIT